MIYHDDQQWAKWTAVVRAAGAGEEGQDRLVVLARQEVPGFGAVMREAWNDAGSPRWAALNAFAARLTLAGIDYRMYAVWTLRGALETDPPEGLPGVEPWFRLCGTLLHDASVAGEDCLHSAPGPLAVAAGVTRPGFSVSRWDFWQSRRDQLAAAVSR